MKIEELIDRYFEGQTSCDEERELRRFFTQENKYTVPCLPVWIKKQKHSRKKASLLKNSLSVDASFI